MEKRFRNYLNVHNKYLWYHYFCLHHSKTKISLGRMMDRYLQTLNSTKNQKAKTRPKIPIVFKFDQMVLKHTEIIIDTNLKGDKCHVAIECNLCNYRVTSKPHPPIIISLQNGKKYDSLKSQISMMVINFMYNIHMSQHRANHFWIGCDGELYKKNHMVL